MYGNSRYHLPGLFEKCRNVTKKKKGNIFGIKTSAHDFGIKIINQLSEKLTREYCDIFGKLRMADSI